MTTQPMLRDYLLATEDAISAGRINDAMTNCEYILTHFPESLEGQRLLGEVYLAQGQLDEAQQTFDWILTNDPENVIVYCDRALICEQLQDYDTALDCYQQAYELSRGNSEIRHEFNLLSEKVGQTSFIFSRAGLARLYMRGDLLSQAVQEWEIVLNANPDRLDARTGLLEALWREGLYDRVEQLATQILQDVPSCLKALLLLAHVTFAQNALKAQELLQQAAMLDPDLIKAQELFSDFTAQSPKDPFLKLLHKAPITLPADAQETLSPAPVASQKEQHANGTNGNAPYADPLVRWSSLDNIIEPQQEYQPVHEGTSFGNWADVSTTNFGSWSTFTPPSAPDSSLPAAQPTPQEASPSPILDENLATWNQQAHPESVQDEVLLDDWQLAQPEDEEQTMRIPHDQELQQDDQQQSWYTSASLEDPSLNLWNSAEDSIETSSGITWGMDEQETKNPAPPAWLDMLTKNEWHQPAPLETVQPSAQSAPIEPSATPAQQQDPEVTEVATPISWSDQVASSKVINPPSLDDEEPFFFGPEWLKSLGAAELGTPVQQPMAQEQKPDSTTPSTSFSTQVQQTAEERSASPLAAPSSVPEASPQPQSLETDSHSEQATPATNEPLMNSETSMPSGASKAAKETLLPVEEGSWSHLADAVPGDLTQNVPTTLEELEKDLYSQGFMPLEPGSLSTLAGVSNDTPTLDTKHEASLSSALAQFGNLEAVPANTAPSNMPPATPVFPPADLTEATPSVPAEEPTPAATPQPVFNGSPAPAQAQPSQKQPDSPFDIELETTMKRPAVRLQAMPPRQPGQATPPSQQILQRGRSGEPSTGGKTTPNITNARGYKERLLLGYQYQLAGSYDDAMQEYRIIIRNAPDLLGEVVSNMRALLKLAPQYSAGYRVLGDAYMRQGEYLQAMEAYNKALSMTKKAKS